MPSTLGLYDVVVLEENNKKYIKITIARGTDDHYYYQLIQQSFDNFSAIKKIELKSSTKMQNGAITKRVKHTFITNSFVFDKLIITLNY